METGKKKTKHQKPKTVLDFNWHVWNLDTCHSFLFPEENFHKWMTWLKWNGKCLLQNEEKYK